MFVFSVNHNGHNFLLEELGVIDKIYVSGYLSIILIIKIPHICHKMGTNLVYIGHFFKDMEVPKQRPRPKIMNFYFKTNFNEFFFLSFLMEIPICVIWNRLNLALLVSMMKGVEGGQKSRNIQTECFFQWFHVWFKYFFSIDSLEWIEVVQQICCSSYGFKDTRVLKRDQYLNFEFLSQERFYV